MNSVAMATYNGEKYISEQIESILCQLNKDDEIVISDDGSTDNTIRIIKQFQKNDRRIKLFDGPHKGIFNNFENAIGKCTGDIIYLSDQDDIWLPDKIKEVSAVFDLNPQINIVLHSGIKFSENNNNLGVITDGYKKGLIRNIIRSSYWGCCMAFRKSYISRFIPFKTIGIAHDQLIGLFGEKDKCVYKYNSNLIMHRIHDNNQTHKANIVVKILFRLRMIKDFMICYYGCFSKL